MKKILLTFLMLFLTTSLYATDSKVSDLDADATPGGDSLLYTVDDPSGTPASKKSTITQVFSQQDLDALSNVGSSTETAGFLLIADGTDYEAVAMSGDGTIVSSGAINIEYEKCFGWFEPADTDDNIIVFIPEKTITVNEVYCRVEGGTSVVVVVGDGTNDMDSQTCDTTGVKDSSLSNNTFTADERIEADIGTVTGTVTQFLYCLRYN